MKKLPIKEFTKKAKILEGREQKRIKGGYKSFSRPYGTDGTKWIEIDIRKTTPDPGKDVIGTGRNHG